QAVNASDFAIAQFRFLRKLMLFHGRQNYRRMSKLVVYTFYKNVLMAVPMAWYITSNGYSGQKFYTELGIQFYNIMFTLWPILFLGCFDRDVSLKDTERFPGLYVLGINDVFFNAKVFWSWMAQAVAEAALITFVPLFLLKGGPGDFGTEQTVFFFGGTTFTLVVLLANSKILWLQYRWTWWAAMLVVVSILAWFGIACIINTLLFADFDFYAVYFHLLANPTFWAVTTLCVTAVAMRDLTWKFYHRWWQPKLHHVILEVEAAGGGHVELTPAQWATASARGGGRGGGGDGDGGGGGRGGGAGGSSSHVNAASARVSDVGITGGLRRYFHDAEGGDGGGGDAECGLRGRGKSDDLVASGRSNGAGGGGGGGGEGSRARGHGDPIIFNRRPTDTMSSRPSSAGGLGGEDGGGSTPATSKARSWSWTLPLDPYPTLSTTRPTPGLYRSRSEQTNKRRPMQGSVGTRFAQAKAPSSGYAYSTDEASASIESEMILNYVESPLKKTPAFWEAPRPTLDRLVRRRERGLLPSGYGTGRWTPGYTAAGAVGPRPHRGSVAAASGAANPHASDTKANAWQSQARYGGGGGGGGVSATGGTGSSFYAGDLGERSVSSHDVRHPPRPSEQPFRRVRSGPNDGCKGDAGSAVDDARRGRAVSSAAGGR
ncbi:unnamed protein product, partial [Laminaria digitata]